MRTISTLAPGNPRRISLADPIRLSLLVTRGFRASLRGLLEGAQSGGAGQWSEDGGALPSRISDWSAVFDSWFDYINEPPSCHAGERLVPVLKLGCS